MNNKIRSIVSLLLIVSALPLVVLVLFFIWLLDGNLGPVWEYIEFTRAAWRAKKPLSDAQLK